MANPWYERNHLSSSSDLYSSFLLLQKLFASGDHICGILLITEGFKIAIHISGVGRRKPNENILVISNDNIDKCIPWHPPPLLFEGPKVIMFLNLLPWKFWNLAILSYPLKISKQSQTSKSWLAQWCLEKLESQILPSLLHLLLVQSFEYHNTFEQQQDDSFNSFMLPEKLVCDLIYISP